MTRTFIALDMHASVQRALGQVLERFALALPNLRWVDAVAIHLTLAFLGELDDDRLALAMEATRAATHDFPVFDYRLTTPGIFGTPQQPRVIWMGVEDRPLAQLHGSPLQRLHQILNRTGTARFRDRETPLFPPSHPGPRQTTADSRRTTNPATPPSQ